MIPTYSWHELYKAALLETDWSKMEERIRAAESALNERKRQFPLDHGGTPEENQAIEDAMCSLNILRKDAASWSAARQTEGSLCKAPWPG
jgi:hypothetical protein